MKQIRLALIGLMLIVSCSVKAQVSVNINIGREPAWGPSGYSDVEYYYLPDVESYYDIRASQFIFLSNGRWIRSRYLPARYRNYNLYNGYKVVLNDFHGSRPYADYRVHRVKYYKGYRKESQRNIGNGTKNYNNHHKQMNSGKNNEDREYKGERESKKQIVNYY